MASSMYREGDNPSPVSSLVPQVRGSRRGSLSSLSSINLLGKETVSLALDQIHYTASQSDALTTFNDYTSPPSSSSGLDSKSITGELQGGISGLYNRFRASVGNVKDAVSPGAQEGGSDKTSLEGSRVSTPTLTKSYSAGRESKRISGVHGQHELVVNQVPQDQAAGNGYETTLERVTTSKALPALFKITPMPTNDDSAPAQEFRDPDGGSKKRSQPAHPNPTVNVQPEGGREALGHYGLSDQNIQSNEQSMENVAKRMPLLHVQSSSSSALRTMSHSPAGDTPGPTKRFNDGTEMDDEDTTKRYQHLEIPLRKSLAPPLLSGSASPRPSLSRASSSETNADSMLNIPRLSSPRHDVRRPESVRSRNELKASTRSALASSDPQDTRMMSVFSQAKSKVLSKEYWMKDENARDCFGCGDAFSTFRRKHHCRTCGQIFDAKCTSVIAGEYFSQPGALRVCKPCEGIIKGDDSSEFSDDGNFSLPGFRPRHGSTGASDTLAFPFPDLVSTSPDAAHYASGNPDLGVPMMSIPATRKAGEKASRKPAVVEIGTERGLARPSSSRSLKSSFGSRTHTPGHRRHNSRNQFPRTLKPAYEDNAPFHHEVLDRKPPNRLATFHDDNIIDPDLAPYLSDDQSSGDEQVSIMAALNGDRMSSSIEDRHGWDAGALSARKARFRVGEKSTGSVIFAGRDADAQSLAGSKSSRPSKRRTFSTSSTTHLRPSPRIYRASALNLGSTSSLRETTVGLPTIQATSPPTPSGICRMLRSSSMRGAAAPTIELNSASLQHVQKLLTQLLTDSVLSDVSGWEKALLPILFRATDDVSPDVQNGDDMDVRHYVKLKKIPGGRPGDTAYVSGLVFTKNLALKTMPRSITHPNILILTFPLEYARHQQHFMSLEPVIRQEKEFLQNLVNRIAALRPQLLLVERHVSGLALEFLEQANIATAYNVKTSVLEAVSRCCQTRIISSIDKLAIKPAQAGKCASFYLKTYHNEGRKKTYMFLSGSAKELGCTIVLRGADTITLKKIKSITEFMVYVVYNLKLETCLMRDESALIPSDVDIGSLSSGPKLSFEQNTRIADDRTQPLSSQTVSQDQAINQPQDNVGRGLTGPADPAATSKSPPNLPDEDSVPDDIPMPTFYTNMVDEHRTKILSASPFVNFMQPYLLMRAREQERRLDYLKRLRDQDILEMQSADIKSKGERFDLIRPEMVHKRVPNAPKKVREVLYAVHDAEYDKALHNYQTQSKQWETYIAGNIDMFNPYAHQNIAVLYSVVCTSTTVPCAGPDLVALGFYNEQEVDDNFEADCTLGQYVEDLCIGASTICTANGCEKQMVEHHRQYVHGEAQVSVFVEQHPCKLVGFSDTILMWSVCRKCGKETETIQMSENTWKYSFGKYLELSFWSTEIKPQAEICPHDIHRDFLRYIGFKEMAVRIHYDPIRLLEIIVPRARITWKVDNDLQFKNEVFTKVEERLSKFMASVKFRIKSISADSVLPEKVDKCRQEVERLGKKATDDHHGLLLKLREKYMNSKHYEIIPLNQAIRALQEIVVEWDTTFGDFDQNFFPSERDIRRLAALQLKKIFLDRDESSASLASDGSNSTLEILDEKTPAGEVPALSPSTRRMSPDKARDMLTSVVEDESSANSQADPIHTGNRDTTSQTHDEVNGDILEVPRKQDVRHLDLAVAPEGLPNTQVDGIRAPSSREEVTSTVSCTPISEKQKPQTSEAPSPPSITAYNDKPELRQVSQLPSARTLSNIAQSSAIPRPNLGKGAPSSRGSGVPSISRTNSHPTIIRDAESSKLAKPGFIDNPVEESQRHATTDESSTAKAGPAAKTGDKKMSERLGLNALKPTVMAAQSMIPRSIAARKRDSRVSHLARHFEQLSREFEKERLKERRQRAVQSRRTRTHPMRASKPIVQVYRSVNEAVEEKEPSDEDMFSSDPSTLDHEHAHDEKHAASEKDVSQNVELLHTEETTAENTEAEEAVIDDSKGVSDVEGEGVRSDDERYLTQGIESDIRKDERINLMPDQLDLKLDLPKHEKTSLMKMLTNFWAERSASGWQPLEYPLHATDHIFADSDIIVREDEPSSLISFALGSEDYQRKLASIINSSPPSARKKEKSKSTDSLLNPTEQGQIEDSLLRSTGTHLKYQFSEGSAKMLCKIFYAEQFDAVRRKCGVTERMAESLSRCMKWDSKGGKTKSVFLKTLDDRFVLKSLSTVETQAFLRFAPAYFRIMSESLFHELPSVIAKMLGFYQIIIKNPNTGVEFNWFLLVMENLFYDRSPNRIFDLKGSMRNRRIQSTGEQNEVLLDENMVEFIYESPLFAREHSKKLLRASVWNDTLFLSRQNVMDYSLMIAIDETKKEIVVGIIDCIRTYTWDKKLESWIKDRGKNRPTVTSPKEYKSRFREAMGRYVLQAPNCWHQFNARHIEASPLQQSQDDPGEDKEAQVLDIA